MGSVNLCFSGTDKVRVSRVCTREAPATEPTAQKVKEAFPTWPSSSQAMPCCYPTLNLRL